MRPPGHGNNCHGHHTAIANGGLGHWEGDSCGCFSGSAPTASIDMGVGLLIIVAVVLVLYKKLKTT